jgi:lipopolysaccharide/colanic/teichoic acid biosynthesis glycosyltransferase
MATVLSTPREETSLQALPQQGAREAVLVPEGPRHLYLTLKLVVDFCLAAVLLVLTAPVLVLCAVLVRLTSRGPALYSQVRLGLGGRPYRIYKLRTMYHQCEQHSGAQWSQKGDPRVTPLGRFLRRAHLDELPQLWNILKGDMSLIGPRPERPEFIPSLAEAVPLYAWRMAVRPGVTGLAQIQLPADSDLAGVRAKVAHDLYYIEHAGAGMDLRIFAATALKVLGASFAWIRRCFRLPGPSAVEQHYQKLQSAARARQAQAELAATP